MDFSPKAPEERFSFGHILSREVDWSIKNHTLKMVIDPWPGVRSGGQCPGAVKVGKKKCTQKNCKIQPKMG